MSEKQQQDSLIDSIREELDHSCDRLDGHTLSRLNRIRHDALEQGQRRSGRALLAPFGGLVTACCVLVIMLTVSDFNQVPENAEETVPNLAIEDLEILTADESLEFYQDFEFYQWLAENDSSV